MSTRPIEESEIDRRRELAGSILTFAGTFVIFSVGFGDWRFGLGFVLLLLVHELGHFLEARRQGLQVSLPRFNPIFAYVRHQLSPTPWRNALISLAGPLAGGLGALALWLVGSARDSHVLLELAYLGFLLNAANLVPVGFLDGGAVLRAISQSRRGWIRYENGVPVEALPPDPEHANLITWLYVALAAALVAGWLATRHSGAF
jgi:Zn-dependent protease